MKFKIHTSAEEKRAELVTIKKSMEVGIFILAAIEIICEFINTQYFDYITISISYVECGLFLYGFLLIMYINRRLDFSAEKYDTLIDFHNTFMTSIIIPMIFIFSNNNTSFENTRIQDFDLLKKITVTATLAAVLYYKLIHYALKKKKPDSLTEDQKPHIDRRVSTFIALGSFIDIAVMLCQYCLFMGMVNKDELLAAASTLFAILIAANILLLNRVEEKKPIVKISFLVVTVLYIIFGTYNVYLEESIQEFHYEKADYYYLTEWSDGSTVEQYCRLESGEADQEILKYVIVYTDSQGHVQTGGSVYEFTAIQAVKGLFRWYDDGHTYVERSFLEKDEVPAIILVSREKTECDDQFLFIKYLENDNYIYTDDQGVEHEWLVEGEDRIRFRNTMLNEINTVPDHVEKLFDELVFE